MHEHTPIMQTSTKNRTSKAEIISFFFLNFKTFPIYRRLEQPLAQSAGELWPSIIWV